MPTDTLPASGEFWSALRARHPGFRASVRADASVNALYRGERHEFRYGFCRYGRMNNEHIKSIDCMHNRREIAQGVEGKRLVER